MPAIQELHTQLGDDFVELRAIAEWDIPEILIAHQDDPMLHVALGERSAPSGAELGREVELADARRRNGERLALTILEPGGRDCRGRVVVQQIDWELASGRLLIWVAPELRGRGFASHALMLVSRWLFEQAGFRRLQLDVSADNEPMLRAAAAAGFVPVPEDARGAVSEGQVLLVAQHG